MKISSDYNSIDKNLLYSDNLSKVNAEQGKVNNSSEESFPPENDPLMLEQIKAKMKNGEELSSKDIKFLREKSPEFYKQARRLEEERAEFVKALTAAKTKDEVGKINSKAIDALSNETKDIFSKDGTKEEKDVEFEFNQARFAAVKDEFFKFAGTKEYKTLPQNERDNSLNAFL